LRILVLNVKNLLDPHPNPQRKAFSAIFLCTLIKRKQIFLIYKEIQSGAVAKSHIRKGFLIYEENLIFFFISADRFTIL
jgi:hypothetical protein